MFDKKFKNPILQEKYDVLKNYKLDDKLNSFDILHIYKTNKKCYPNGYYDAQFFNLVIFNSKKMTYREIKNKDGITFYDSANSKINLMRVFLDGAFFVSFKEVQSILYTGQDIIIK